jgi:hypothetical protein
MRLRYKTNEERVAARKASHAKSYKLHRAERLEYFKLYNKKRRAVKRIEPKKPIAKIVPVIAHNVPTASFNGSPTASVALFLPISGSISQPPINDLGNETKKPRKVRSDKKQFYWTQATTDAVVKYNNTEDIVERNKIYEEELHAPLSKLVECVFNTFKFSYFETGPHDVQKECLAHVISHIHKFDPNRLNKLGQKPNAFSYCSIIAKHFLILLNNTTYKRFNTFESMDDPGPFGNDDHYDTNTPEKLIIQSKYDTFDTSELNTLLVEYMDRNTERIFTNARDRVICNGVMELMRNANRIEAVNKKALYLYIREITGYKTNQISKVVTKLKTYVANIAKAYASTGEVDMDGLYCGSTSKQAASLEIEKPRRRKNNLKSEWFRKCDCGKRLYYSTRGALTQSLKAKSKCQFCGKRPA